MMRLTGSGILIATSLLFCGCYRVQRQIEPHVHYTVQDRYLKQLPSPFAPLTFTEKSTDWGKEYLIGVHFAKTLDLYRAITAFRRAEILAPTSETSRKLEIHYEILLCYYIGQRYDELIQAYNASPLSQVTTTFPAFHDLLVILYDAYQKTDQQEQACHVLEIIRCTYPDTYNTLVLSSAMQSANLPCIREIANNPPKRPYLDALLDTYDQRQKSPTKAATFNALLPGAGYYYLGQRQTAVTAFFINSLFIASSTYFFIHGPITAGIITASFEAGWYFGGIYGAANQAKFYNERLYESMANPLMNREGLFPIFRLNYAF